MTNSSRLVYPLASSQISRAEKTLADAFDADRMAIYFFPCAATRHAGLRRIFRVGLHYGLRYGRVDTIHEGAAVAIWLRSEYATASLSRMARTGMLTVPFAVGWGAIRRILSFLHFIEAERLRAISSPHWYLLNIAACPDRQGQGLGATLLRHGMTRAQEQGIPCYLETTNERNVAFYEKHGFRVTRPAQAPNGGPSVWGMLAPNP